MRVGRAVVEGPSMVPTLRHGDRLLVVWGTRPRAGDVAVVVDPQRPGLLTVKRLVHETPEGWWVLGDNPYGSDDSRSYGSVPAASVLARALLRYAPLRDAGRWPLRRVR